LLFIKKRLTIGAAMSNSSIQNIRTTFISWAEQFKKTQQGHLSLKGKSLVIKNVTQPQGQKNEKHQINKNLKSLVDFMHNHFDEIISKEDTTTISKLREACDLFDSQIGSKIKHDRGLLRDKLDKKIEHIPIIPQKGSKELEIETIELTDLTEEFSFKNEIEQDVDKTPSHPYAKDTIKGIFLIYENREKIAQIEKESERNTYITKLTKLVAEPGFCSGTSKKARIGNLEEKIALLKTTYEEAKANHELEAYFTTAFKSDPCFNGRISSLLNYAREKSHIPEETLIPELPIKDLNVLNDIYDDYREAAKTKDIPDSFESFCTYLKDYATKDQTKLSIIKKYKNNTQLLLNAYPVLKLAYI